MQLDLNQAARMTHQQIFLRKLLENKSARRTAMISVVLRLISKDVHKRKNITFILTTSLQYTPTVLLMHFLFYSRAEYQLFCTTI